MIKMDVSLGVVVPETNNLRFFVTFVFLTITGNPVRNFKTKVLGRHEIARQKDTTK
jgi:hypothetical protein